MYKVFASMGTPLSDPTEEKQWRKLVHRATNVRNRHPNKPDHRCHLCLNHEESMFNLFQCVSTAPLWKACMHFCYTALSAPRTPDIAKAIILGLWKDDELGPEDARAFLRHAYGVFYDEFSVTDINSTPFVWQKVFRDALLSFRDAAFRRAQTIRRQFIHRVYSTLPEQVPEEELTRYSDVIGISPDGTASLALGFQTAIDNAVQAHTDAVNAARVGKGGGRRGGARGGRNGGRGR
jgi:hypothetical protein